MKAAYLTINGLKLHHTIAGQGAPALLVHGHASSQELWARVKLPELGQPYCHHAFDLPGHGASAKPPLEWFTLENYTQTLYEFCCRLDLKDILLVGHSMGSLLCLNLALAHPGLVSQLILIAPVAEGSFLSYLDPLLRLERFACQPLAERLLRIYNAHPWLAAPVALKWYARPGMLLTDSFKQARSDFARCPISTLFGNFKMVRRTDLRGRLPHLRLPTLLISGDQDRVVPPSQAETIAKRVPQAKLAMIPQCGHLPFDEHPALFEAAIQEYFESLGGE